MGSSDGRKFLIITKEEYEGMTIDYDEVMETGASSLRWNNDETKTFFKYTGSKPACLSSITGVLSYEDMLAELQNEEWVDPDEL